MAFCVIIKIAGDASDSLLPPVLFTVMLSFR